MKSAEYTSFPISLHPIFTRGEQINKKKALVRDDTGRTLALVSDQYEIITHDEVLASLKPFTDLLGGKTNEHTWLDKGGSVLTYLVDYKYKKGLAVGDEVGMRVCVRNAYDGKTSCSIRIGALVLSCTNGMVKDGAVFKNLNIRHVASGKAKLEVPEKEVILNSFDNAVSIWDKYGEIKLSPSEHHSFSEKLVQTGYINRNTLGIIQDSKPETVWDYLQGVTYNITHERDRLGQDSRIGMLSRVDSFFEQHFINPTIH
jgi:hypothetical protein